MDNHNKSDDRDKTDQSSQVCDEKIVRIIKNYDKFRELGSGEKEFVRTQRRDTVYSLHHILGVSSESVYIIGRVYLIFLYTVLYGPLIR